MRTKVIAQSPILINGILKELTGKIVELTVEENSVLDNEIQAGSLKRSKRLKKNVIKNRALN